MAECFMMENMGRYLVPALLVPKKDTTCYVPMDRW